MPPHTPTILCLASYFKGMDFLRAAKARGWRVLLVTSDSLQQEAWPRESVDEFFYMPGEKDKWDLDLLIKGLDGVATREFFDVVVALDDFDVERAALVREHFRVPGMGQTRARYFRDKLAMRMMAQEAGVPVPPFVQPFHYDMIHEFTRNVEAPWMLKPRSQASALGIKKIFSANELWAVLDKLGHMRTHYVLEQFIPGDVYHVDALAYEQKIVFARAHKYMSPPFDVSHGGGLFRTHTVAYGSEEEKSLLALNEQVAKGFGMHHSAMHTEFLRAHADGKYYFIETAARVGGAHIAEMLEASSGINLWTEWANMETSKQGEKYALPKARKDYSGSIITLARQTHPDLSGYTHPEIAWRLEKEQHAGLIVTSKKQERVIELLDEYARRFMEDFHASAPAPDRPAN